MRVAGYGRVSTQGQIDGTSPEEQRRAIEDECLRNGDQLVNFISDMAYSGSDDDRPGLKQLLNESKTGQFEVVMFTKLDRLGRNLRDIKNILHEISVNGLKYKCIQQPEISNQGFYGDLMLNILAAFAEFEASIIRDRTNSGRMSNWRKQTSVIGSLPFGYKHAEGKIVCDDKEAKIYKWIVSMYLYENLSFRDIAIKLTSEGIPTSSGKSQKWHNVTVSKILKNPAYTGQTIQNKFEFKRKRSVVKGKQYYCVSKVQKPDEQWISIKYPPLISREQFDQIQSKTQYQKRKAKKHHVGYENHFMAENVLFCGYCGSRIKKRIKPSGKIQYCCYWWEASNKERQVSQREKCKLKYEDADEIDDMIFDEIVKILSNPRRFAKNWFKNFNLENLTKKSKILTERDDVLRLKLAEGFKIIKNTKNPELKAIYELAQIKDVKDFEENQIALKENKRSLEFSQNKYNRLETLCNVMNQGKAEFIKTWFPTVAELSTFLYNLPFQEKKRIVESIISPENGGKILLRRCNDIELGEEELTIDMDFNIDLNRIEALINSLNKNELLNKLNSGRIP